MQSSPSQTLANMESLGRLSRAKTEELKTPSFKDEYVMTSKMLGEGNQGIVRKCIRIKDNKEFAVKIICKGKLSKRNILCLQREIKILKKLSNLKNQRDLKYFNKLINYYESKNKVYLVLNLCKGGDLFEFVSNIHASTQDKNAISEEYFKRIFYQICRGVHIAHKNGIVHRDLKPENILFTDKRCKQVNISDFGLSSINQSTMLSGCGSPHYIAPELIGGQPYGDQVDWWSCGVLLYVCLSGQYPFDHPNDIGIYRQILLGEYNFKSSRWDTVSSKAKDLISKLLERDPDKRLSFSQILKHPWIQSLNLVPSSNQSSKNLSKKAPINQENKFEKY